jgi:putative endonuclease
MASRHFVYVLRSERTGRRYVGSCDDVPARVDQHNRGKTNSTKSGVPWKLVHQEEFQTRAQAIHRERQLKKGKGQEELDRRKL